MNHNLHIKHIVNRSALLIAIVMLFAFVQCSFQNEKHEDDTAGHKVDYQETNFHREKNKLESNLKELRDQIDGKLTAVEKNIVEASADAREKLNAAKDRLTNERAELNKTLDQIGHASENTWEDVKKDADNSYDRVKNSFEDLKANVNALMDDNK